MSVSGLLSLMPQVHGFPSGCLGLPAIKLENSA